MANTRALAALFVIPSLLAFSPAHASDSVPAGFAPGPVWLSQQAPAAGASVRIYTVVYDGSASAIEGSVSFKIDGTTVGSTPFSLDAGESAIESTVWTAIEGAHTVSAEITSAVDKKTKVSVQIGSTTTTTLAVSVTPPPPKSAALEAVDTAQSAVTSGTPIVQNAVAQTVAVTESIRTAGESYLTSLAGSQSTASSSPKKGGSVLGAQTERTDDSATTDTAPGYTAKIASALLPLFTYPALFYPVFLFLILLLLWILARKLRNPTSKKR